MSASNTLSFAPQGSLKVLATQTLARIRAARALAAERARVRFELDQYSPRELADMGLSPSDIDGIVASVSLSAHRAI